MLPRWAGWIAAVVVLLLVLQVWIIPAQMLGLELTTNALAVGGVITFILAVIIAGEVRERSRSR